MNQTGGGVAVEVQGGDGLLARRASALLFTPDAKAEGIDALLEAFLSGDDSSAAVCERLVDNELHGPAFVVVEWSTGVCLTVFGSLEVTTDQPAVPMLSGASSASWVEHTLHQIRGDAATITLDAPAEGSMTSLDHGVVPAGGFRLSVPAGAPTSVELPPSAGISAPTLAPPDAHLAVQVTETDQLSSGSEVDTPIAVTLPPAIDPSDSAASLAAIQAAAVSEHAGVSPIFTAEPEVTDHPEATILPPARPSLHVVREVPAKLCSSGHANPPDAAVCWTCEVLLAPGEHGVVDVPDPQVAQLRMDDETVVALDRATTIGRGSSGNGGQHVQMDGENISRIHLQLAVRDWSVFIKDARSTNGTIVVVTLEAEPERLTPEEDHLLAFGTTVYIGTRSFTLEKPGTQT